MEASDCRERKAALRAQAAAARDALPLDRRRSADTRIRERLLSLDAWQRAQTVFLYVSFRSEVDTHDLLAEALAAGKRVLAPRVVRERGMIEACRIESAADLQPGRWGILEPPADPERVADPLSIDLVAVPGLAFDLRGGRVGYGAGYYDRYLAGTRPDCVRAALAYEVQVVPEVPCGPGDERMHLILTEERLIRVG